jgi:hypothetical protein
LVTNGNVNATTGTYGSPYNAGVNNTAGNVNLLGALVFTGTNPWILHTPNDTDAGVNRTSLYLAPNSDWSKQTRFYANGDVSFSGNVTLPMRVAIGDVSCTSGCAGNLNINGLTLAVGGKIGARMGVHVMNVGVAWPDYVFAPAYGLSPLPEVEAFIQANHHLPDMPSAAEVQTEGVELVTMQALLLKKVEELTLHLIQMEKEKQALEARVQKLEH